MNIQEENSARYFQVQSEREQTLSLAWTKKKRSLINEKLKARKEMLRIRRENKKTENHE